MASQFVGYSTRDQHGRLVSPPRSFLDFSFIRDFPASSASRGFCCLDFAGDGKDEHNCARNERSPRINRCTDSIEPHGYETFANACLVRYWSNPDRQGYQYQDYGFPRSSGSERHGSLPAHVSSFPHTLDREPELRPQ